MPHAHKPSRTAAALAALSLAVPLAACTEGTGSTRGTDGGSGPPRSSPVAAAPHRLSFLADDGVPAPEALVTVPSGFDDTVGDPNRAPTGRAWYVLSYDSDVFLGLWTVRRVPLDACHRALRKFSVPGPSVRDLARALVAQESTRATAPRPATLAGHRGLYLELAGPHDVDACDEVRFLWSGPGERGIYSDDQVDRVWILDVEGQRVVVDASYAPLASDSQVADLRAMVRSIEIVPASRG